MFAYCLNNSANGSDPCGTCFHRLDFWNDCEKCGGKSFGEKWDEYAVSLYESHMMQIESQQRVNEITFNCLKNSAIVVTKAIVESIEIQNNVQMQQDQVVHDYIMDRFSTPQKASKTLSSMSATLSLVSAYSGAVAYELSIPTLGMSVPVAGKISVVTGLLAAVLGKIAVMID